ncbi:MAG: hypothetical protein ABI232_12610 [Jatrophihabitantaceae bacterium]
MTDENTASPQRVGPSRRTFLIGSGVAVAVGAGGGIAAGALRAGPHRSTPSEPPPVLVAALASELALIASIKASTGGGAAVQAKLAEVARNHLTHATVLQALIDDTVTEPTPSHASGSPSQPPSAPPLTLARLAAAERRASATAARRAAALSGRDATLLASIAACEATHVALLS